MKTRVGRPVKRARTDSRPSPRTGNRQKPGGEEWGLWVRVGFRFAVAYLGLFALGSQIVGSLVPGVGFRGLGPLWPMRPITDAVADGVFGLAGPLDSSGANGETAFFWVQTLWILVLAVIVTVLWSWLDHRRLHYASGLRWFRLFVRFGLAAQMFEYGMTKVIPTQFPAPSLTTLATDVGDLSLSASLWATVGASPAYEMFTGFAEMLGGLLLLVPGTSMAGALVCLADLIHVFALNMTYDIGLKLTSFHLILLCLFLLAPDFRRIVDFFLLNRPVAPAPETRLFMTSGANRLALVAQVGFGLCLIAGQAWLNVAYWHAVGGGAPVSPLYGIWNVEELAIDGEVRPPDLNGYDLRWRRVIFDGPNEIVFQRTDDSFARYGATIDVGARRLAMTKGGSRNWASTFSFERPGAGELLLDGELDGYQIRMRLARVEFDTFRLLNSHFRWIRPDVE